MKVALYMRVSTEEQAKHGISIDAQRNELREYAKTHKYTVIGEYADEGYSGGTLQRPELERLLNDVKQGEIQTIIFVKLDRWFRSVAHYYKIQEILEQYNVEWIATQEDYETITSSGKFKVNIMLSVSQQFKDATSERIKTVIDYKLDVTKTAINGTKVFGYDIVNKKYVINEEEAKIVNELFDKYLENNCINQTLLWFRENYHPNCHLDTVIRRLKNKKYIGIYENRGKEYLDVIPPIVGEEKFYKVQNMFSKNIKRPTKGTYSYMFGGMIFCKICGRRMAASSDKRKYGKYLYYRCPRERDCSNHFNVSEPIIEKYVLTQLPILIEEKSKINKITEADCKKKKNNIDKLKQKAERLKELYIDGEITKEYFKKKNDELQNEIQKNKITKHDSNVGKEITNLIQGKEFRAYYDTFSPDDKRFFYSQIIDKIIIYGKDDINIILS